MLRTRLLRLLLLPAALLLAIGVAYPAFAATGNGHFIKNATSATLSGANLVTNFKEAGLAAGSVETITTNATATTTYECVNGGGKNPSASNKTTTVTQVSQSGQFTADQNGNLVGSQTLSPPTAQQLGFSCPPGQWPFLAMPRHLSILVSIEGTHSAPFSAESRRTLGKRSKKFQKMKLDSVSITGRSE